jgi:thiol-disulfide isomerase/thioredoxin
MLLTGKMKKNRWIALASTSVAAAILATAITGFAANVPATPPATTQPTAVKARSAVSNSELQAILTDFQSNSKELNVVLGDRSSLGDATRRADLTGKATPLLQRNTELVDELMTQPQMAGAKVQLNSMKQRDLAILYLLKDEKTVKTVDEMKTSEKQADKSNAQTITFLSGWMSATGDSTAQAGMADQLIKLDEASPKDASLTSLSYSLAHEIKDKTTSDKLIAAATSMQTPMAKALLAQAEGAKKLASLEGKPLAVAGKTPEGKDFTTADWKGKVVLVDFWATWCGPCKAELPRVKKMYSDYHDKGLEILSVSNDYNGKTLTDFTAKNGMPWPELYDDAAGSDHQWNPITLGYGINGIPTMFLIDKKGICRTVEARSKMEDLIPTLLAE